MRCHCDFADGESEARATTSILKIVSEVKSDGAPQVATVLAIPNGNDPGTLCRNALETSSR